MNMLLRRKARARARENKVSGVIRDTNLTQKEVEALSLVGTGRTNEEIAVILGVATNTIKGRLQNLSMKLSTSSRTALVVRAVRCGALRLDEIPDF